MKNDISKTEDANRSCAEASGSDLPSLVGLTGTFIASTGEVCECVVRDHDDPPWAENGIVVDYVCAADGRKVTGAWISRNDFIPAPCPPHDWVPSPSSGAHRLCRKCGWNHLRPLDDQNPQLTGPPGPV
jgi:hypothetical protein